MSCREIWQTIDAKTSSYHYFRSWNSSGVTPFGFSSNDSSFEIVKSADFLVFDENRGLELLGPNASYEFMFNVPDYVHEAPVYAPVQNKLFLSELHPGVLHQLVVNLNQDPPVLEQYIPTPPVYAPNGGTFHDGLIIFGASGGNDSIGGGEQRPSIRTLDPAENTTVSLLNNYFGIYFNTIDDLAVHPVTGDIWFTDPGLCYFHIEYVNRGELLALTSFEITPGSMPSRILRLSFHRPLIASTRLLVQHS